VGLNGNDCELKELAKVKPTLSHPNFQDFLFIFNNTPKRSHIKKGGKLKKKMGIYLGLLEHEKPGNFKEDELMILRTASSKTKAKLSTFNGKERETHVKICVGCPRTMENFSS